MANKSLRLIAKKLSNTTIELLDRSDDFESSIGLLINRRSGPIFQSHDELLMAGIQPCLKRGQKLPVMLTIIRDAYEALLAHYASEAEAERWAERAWLRAAETCDEHRADMDHDDVIGRM